MLKIVFLIPPSIDGKKPAERTAGCTRVVYKMPNIYELTVAALLEEYHFSVDYQSDFQSIDSLNTWLRQTKYDIYILWSVNLSLDTDIQVENKIYELHPQSKVIYLGPGPTYFIDKCLQHSNTIVVRGEPEYSLLECLQKLDQGLSIENTQGISYLKNGQIINEDYRPLIDNLDRLPFPARHFIEHIIYHNPKLKCTPYTTMVTSRNCPYQCIYCVPSSLTFAREIETKRYCGHKPSIGFRSVENVNAEIEYLASSGYQAIAFVDDNFIWNYERTAGIVKTLKKYHIKWGCQARVDAIDESIAKLLENSGCVYVDLGVESFDNDILKFIRKKITKEQIYQAIALLKKYKVGVKLNILIGTSPLETVQSIKHTLKEAKKLKVDQIMFNIVSPFPATDFYTMAMEKGWIAGNQYKPTDVQRESILNYPHLSAREMERLLFRNNLLFFLDPRIIFKQLKKFTSFKEFIESIKALKNKLFKA